MQLISPYTKLSLPTNASVATDMEGSTNSSTNRAQQLAHLEDRIKEITGVNHRNSKYTKRSHLVSYISQVMSDASSEAELPNTTIILTHNGIHFSQWRRRRPERAKKEAAMCIRGRTSATVDRTGGGNVGE